MTRDWIVDDMYHGKIKNVLLKLLMKLVLLIFTNLIYVYYLK